MTTGFCKKTLLGHYGRVNSVEILSNTRVASCASDQTIRIWDTESGQCLKELLGQYWEISTLKKISNDYLTSGYSNGKIELWNLNTGESLRIFGVHSIDQIGIVTKDRIAPRSRNLETIKVYDISTGECLQNLIGHTSAVKCMCVQSADRIISGSFDGKIKIWCLKTNN